LHIPENAGATTSARRRTQMPHRVGAGSGRWRALTRNLFAPRIFSHKLPFRSPMQINTRTGVRSALVSALLCLTTPALAQEAIDLDALDEGGSATPSSASGVMVRPFSGPRSQTIHGRVQKALKKDGLTIVPVGFEAGVKLEDEAAPYIQVAKESGIRAYVHGTVKMTKRSWTLTMRVRNGATGEFVGEQKVTSGWLPGLLKAIDKSAMSKLQPLLDQTSAPGSGGGSSGGVGGADGQLIPPGEAGAASVSLVASDEDSDFADDGVDDDSRAGGGSSGHAIQINASGG